MTYTLVFRVTGEVMDALESGKKKTEYRDCKPFWDARMSEAQWRWHDERVEALFFCGPRSRRYTVGYIRRWCRDGVEPWERKYLKQHDIWAVELGERIGP